MDDVDMDAINALPRFDVADHLDSEEEITAYLNVYLEEEDVAMFIRGLGTVARARAKASTVPDVSVHHHRLYQALSEELLPWSLYCHASNEIAGVAPFCPKYRDRK